VKRKVIYSLVCLLFIMGAFIAFGFKEKEPSKSLELQRLVIKDPAGKRSMILEMVQDEPRLLINDERGQPQIVLKGGDAPTVALFDEQDQLCLELKRVKNESQITVLNQGKQKALFNNSGIYLKNDKEKVVGSFLTLSDGGGGFGLADSDGMASSILRGGQNPSLALFGKKSDPITSFGVLQNVPHLLLTGEMGNESILLHGGSRSGLMVLDEAGQLKIFICKDGIYQGKQENMQEGSPKKEKFFSYTEDKALLFPEQKMR
jgi:hypothetical protein